MRFTYGPSWGLAMKGLSIGNPAAFGFRIHGQDLRQIGRDTGPMVHISAPPGAMVVSEKRSVPHPGRFADIRAHDWLLTLTPKPIWFFDAV